MISACILINMTFSLARQIIPPGLGVQLTLLAALHLEPVSFSSHTKKWCQGFLIEINFNPWNPWLPPCRPWPPTPPREYQLNPGRTRLRRGGQDGGLKSSVWRDSHAAEHRAPMNFGNLSVCMCACSSFPSPLHVLRLSGYWIRWPDYPGLSCGRPLEAWEAPVAMQTAQSRTQRARMSFVHQGHEGLSAPAALSNEVPTGELLLTSIFFNSGYFLFMFFLSSVFWHSTESGERLANSTTPFRVFFF